jgi:glycosyltransferase involved in cell wall biosynthesis
VRIAVLWTRSSGYFTACLRALAARPDCEVMLSRARPDDSAPFAEDEFAWLSGQYLYDRVPDAGELHRRLARFKPDVLLVCSWHIAAYRQALGRFPMAVRILAMDNQWRATARQWLGVLTARRYLHPLYDVAFVPGERQAQFARRLGFPQARIWHGLYACDHETFAGVHRSRSAGKAWTPPESFVFTGRLVPEKGIATLAAAYRLYAESVKTPWPLIVCGTGPLAAGLERQPGIAMRGFVQPRDLPGVFAEGGCLVLPSLSEPWGVVIQEAVAAGLAVICTTRCGASVHLVQDGYNGFVVEAGDAAGLARSMRRYAGLDAARRRAMAENGHALSFQFTPQRWAATIHEGSAEILAGRL